MHSKRAEGVERLEHWTPPKAYRPEEPKMINGTAIDDVIRSTHEYDRDHLGMKNGPDFSVVVGALLESGQFKQLCMRATALALVVSLMAPRKEELAANKEAAMNELFEASPIRSLMADVFYMGYSAG